MTLQYLEFDFSEDPQGHGSSFDAMASGTSAQRAAMEEEIVRVLEWAHRAFGPPGAIDDGAQWDCELQGVQELPTTLAVRYDAQARRLQLEPAGTGAVRVTLSVTVSGTAQFCQAFHDRFRAC